MTAAAAPAPRGPDIIHVQVLPSFQQPTFQTFTTNNICSAAWSAFHLKHVAILFVSSEILKCRLLNLLSASAMQPGSRNPSPARDFVFFRLNFPRSSSLEECFFTDTGITWSQTRTDEHVRRYPTPQLLRPGCSWCSCVFLLCFLHRWKS